MGAMREGGPLLSALWPHFSLKLEKVSLPGRGPFPPPPAGAPAFCPVGGRPGGHRVGPERPWEPQDSPCNWWGGGRSSRKSTCPSGATWVRRFPTLRLPLVRGQAGPGTKRLPEAELSDLSAACRLGRAGAGLPECSPEPWDNTDEEVSYYTKEGNPSLPFHLSFFFFFLRFYLFIHETHTHRGRDSPCRGRSRCLMGSRMWDAIPGSQDHALSQRQALNR